MVSLEEQKIAPIHAPDLCDESRLFREASCSPKKFPYEANDRVALSDLSLVGPV